MCIITLQKSFVDIDCSSNISTILRIPRVINHKNTIYTSSYAVVHLIDGALMYDEEQMEKYE